jgi:SAM-dependent methyltransferase
MSAGDTAPSAPHGPGAPSEWVRRFAGAIPTGGEALDVACGGGRHTRLLLERGLRVVCVDRDTSGVADLEDRGDVRIVAADLEADAARALPTGAYAAVVVTNYLHRPLLAHLVAAVGPGGLLIYETFAAGNERYGRPRSPAHLLQPGELLEAVRGRLRVLAYEDVTVEAPRPAAVQRICARREADH